MANNWGIPKEVEKLVRERDVRCVYCGVDFSQEHVSRKTKPTWEHFINDIRINRENNIALSCTSCNASKGAKLFSEWLESNYCKSKGITVETVAEVIKRAVLEPPKLVYRQP
jgi:hypothetical protein